MLGEELGVVVEEERLFKVNTLNEVDAERDRATRVLQTSELGLRV